LENKLFCDVYVCVFALELEAKLQNNNDERRVLLERYPLSHIIRKYLINNNNNNNYHSGPQTIPSALTDFKILIYILYCMSLVILGNNGVQKEKYINKNNNNTPAICFQQRSIENNINAHMQGRS